MDCFPVMMAALKVTKKKEIPLPEKPVVPIDLLPSLTVIPFVATTYEDLSHYLYGKYSSNQVQLSSCSPSIEDKNSIHVFYVGASDNDKFLIDNNWYKHPHFKL